jgi:hypothetical protein
MNRYGLMAQQHWAQWLPTRYAAIEDPDSFFSDLGKRVADRIDILALQLAGDDQPGEGYLGKAGRLGQARHQAEEIVLAEMVLLDPESGAADG